MPINILLTFIIGSGLGWILVKVTRAPQHLRGVILGCCAAGNIFFSTIRTFLVGIQHKMGKRQFKVSIQVLLWIEFEQEIWEICP